MATIRQEDKPDGTLATATRIISGRVFGNVLVQAALVFLALMWTIPTGGLLISSFRTPNAIRQTGWWTIFTGPQTVDADISFASSPDGGDDAVEPGATLSVPAEESELLNLAVEGFPSATVNGFRVDTITGIATVEELGEPIDVPGVGTVTVNDSIGVELDGEGDYDLYSMTDLGSLNIEEVPYTFEYDMRAVLEDETDGSVVIEQFGNPVTIEGVGTVTVRRNGSFDFEAAEGFGGIFDPSINEDVTLETPYELDYELIESSVEVVQGSVEIESLDEPVMIEDYGSVTLVPAADVQFEAAEGYDGFLIADLDETEETPFDFEYELSGTRNVEGMLNIVRPNISQTVPQIGSIVVFDDGTYVFEPRGNFAGTFEATLPDEIPTNEQIEVPYTATRSGGVLTRGDAGETTEISGVGSFMFGTDGSYEFTANEDFRGEVDMTYEITEPLLTLDNYEFVLFSDGMGLAFLNSLTVTIPATIIPISIAAFASYAFSWMEFPGRRILFVIVVGLQVVPLHLALIPMLRIYTSLGINGTFLAMWLAHTGFGMPLAIFLLRNYIGNLPRELIESASIDGASHFVIFVRLVLPLSVPALAAFAIFQFLWVWNDLIVALVFLGNRPVVTSRLSEMVGSRGQDWHVLTAGAFISMSLPLVVFFSLQRYFVRGLLAGSVKGG